jgi:hypothetical protein
MFGSTLRAARMGSRWSCRMPLEAAWIGVEFAALEEECFCHGGRGAREGVPPNFAELLGLHGDLYVGIDAALYLGVTAATTGPRLRPAAHRQADRYSPNQPRGIRLNRIWRVTGKVRRFRQTNQHPISALEQLLPPFPTLTTTTAALSSSGVSGERRTCLKTRGIGSGRGPAGWACTARCRCPCSAPTG